jgi:hypothetical protein
MSAHQVSFPIATMARVLGVSEAGYCQRPDTMLGGNGRRRTQWLTRRC